MKVLLLAVMAIVGLLLAAECSHRADAHEGHFYAQRFTPDERDWFSKQHVPPNAPGAAPGGYCCNESDGEFVEEDIRNGVYWIRCPLDGLCPFKEWTEIPQNKVIQEPNKHGRAAVWWTFPVGQGGPAAVRCFIPGALF